MEALSAHELARRLRADGLAPKAIAKVLNALRYEAGKVWTGSAVWKLIRAAERRAYYAREMGDSPCAE